MKYRVFQSFETLGDPCASTHDTREAAESAAEKLRGEVAQFVQLSGPEYELRPWTGFAREAAAWEQAERITGATRDSAGYLTEASPRNYSPEAGALIAQQAVTIEEISEVFPVNLERV